AGERSGNLVEVLNRYIQYQKTIFTVRKKFLNSLIYPAFLIVLAVVMIGVILTYVIPKFGELYADLNTPLPVTTRFLIATSNTVRDHLALVAPLVIGGLIALKIWLGSGRGKHWLDELKLT